MESVDGGRVDGALAVVDENAAQQKRKDKLEMHWQFYYWKCIDNSFTENVLTFSLMKNTCSSTETELN